MRYQDLKNMIRNHLNSAAEDFFMVGYLLRQISENALFTEDGYGSIWEFAKGEYGLSTSSASRFMAINARFSIDGGEHMAEKYVGMGVSRLQEMLGLPDEELEKVTRETTVREIRAMKKKQEVPLSFFGLPKTVRPEGSLVCAPGCGGKHSCFICARPCGIRQEERQCRTAPLLTPFSCTQMCEERRLDIEAGPFRDECQHLNPELAPIREGDKEPSPCCLNCGHKTCLSRCDVATKRDRDERKREQEALRKRQKEAEAAKPDLTEREMEILYEWIGIKPEDAITAAWLKETHGRTYHGGGHGGTCFNCSPRGVRTNRSREMNWAQAAKVLREIQGKKREPAGSVERQKRETEEKGADKEAWNPENPEITDADFREVKVEVEDKPEPEREETRIQEPETELKSDAEKYGRPDIALLLDRYRRELKAYHEAKCPLKLIQKQRILVDALTLLLEQFGRMEENGK